MKRTKISESLWKRTMRLPQDLLLAVIDDVETHLKNTLKVMEREVQTREVQFS